MKNSAMKYKYSKIQKVFIIWEILFTVAWFVNSVLYIKYEFYYISRDFAYTVPAIHNFIVCVFIGFFILAVTQVALLTIHISKTITRISLRTFRQSKYSLRVARLSNLPDDNVPSDFRMSRIPWGRFDSYFVYEIRIRRGKH